jgi:hypothetical protein
MVVVEDAILADTARGRRRGASAGQGRAAVAGDLVRAFTRADRHDPA